MKLKPNLLVLAMGLAIGTSAHAYDPVLEWTGNMSSTGALSMGFTIDQPGLTHVATLVDNGFLADFDFLALGVFKTGDGSMGSLIGPGSFSFTPTVPGSYTAVVFGDPGSFGPFTYSTFGVTITPVPEPETWAMLLAGLGLVGLQLRRKMKAVDRIALN
ncbi:MAG: FxDxF family PEP-CTERM protein [Thiobacillaceae bacterium]